MARPGIMPISDSSSSPCLSGQESQIGICLSSATGHESTFTSRFEKKNSLVNVIVHFSYNIKAEYHLNQNELAKIAFYTHRNNLLPTMLLESSPRADSVCLLPQLFSVALPSRTGPWLILKNLLRVKEMVGPKERTNGKRRGTPPIYCILDNFDIM